MGLILGDIGLLLGILGLLLGILGILGLLLGCYWDDDRGNHKRIMDEHCIGVEHTIFIIDGKSEAKSNLIWKASICIIQSGPEAKG